MYNLTNENKNTKKKKTTWKHNNNNHQLKRPDSLNLIFGQLRITNIHTNHETSIYVRAHACYNIIITHRNATK